jgi:decaprenylphospho-beta-D-ribofuranose 2-oxidase
MVAGLPHGWFVPVSPGTRQVTVGGAIAADVHGKNHHVAGSFASHVTSFDILFPNADQTEPHTVTPEGDPELFWATAGGMGLTGFITRATIRLKRVESSLVKVDTVKTRDIDETMAVLAEHDRKYGYTVAWTDDLATGRHLGRSIITSGDFADLDDLDSAQRSDPYQFDPRARLAAPGVFPPGLMNRYSIRLANAAWYLKAPVLPPARRDQELEPRLRPRRLPAVPVRDAVRRGGGRQAQLRDGQRPPRPELRHRAQAVRAGRPGPAVLPRRGLDPRA